MVKSLKNAQLEAPESSEDRAKRILGKHPVLHGRLTIVGVKEDKYQHYTAGKSWFPTF